MQGQDGFPPLPTSAIWSTDVMLVEHAQAVQQRLEAVEQHLEQFNHQRLEPLELGLWVVLLLLAAHACYAHFRFRKLERRPNA